MDCERAEAGSGGDLTLTRPPSILSLKTAVSLPSLPSLPPAVPLPPLPKGVTSPTTSRPGTSRTSRTSTPGTPRGVSFGSLSSRPTKIIKYGTGKYSHVELVPQPSDDPEDPLNWSQWRKESNLVSLLMMVGLIGAMKTAFISTNGDMATHFSVSYTYIAALTAAPLMVSTLTGMASSIVAKLYGKRPVYLASSVLVFIGCILNTTAENSYGLCMGARVIQGLGWGAFDALLMESIQDTYYEHERNIRVSLYDVLSIATTWGSPLIGGVISYNLGTFAIQYRIISALFFIAFLLLALGAPETAFDRSRAVIAPTPVTPISGFVISCPWQLPQANRKLTKATVIDYVKEMKPWSFRGDKKLSTVVQAPRALAAPTTILVFLLTFIPQCALWGLTASLGLLLTPSPIDLASNVMGTLMTGPWILATFVVAGLYLYRSTHQKFSRFVGNLTIAGGAVLAIVGFLSFGLVIDNLMIHTSSDTFFTSEAARRLRLPVLSLQLGLLAAGASALDATTRPFLARSASFTASSMATAQRSIGDMHSCVIIMRNLLAGAFVLATPHAVAVMGGLKALVIGLAAAQFVLTVFVVALWWFFDEAVWKADGKVMGLMDMRMSKLSGSFFDTD